MYLQLSSSSDGDGDESQLGANHVTIMSDSSDSESNQSSRQLVCIKTSISIYTAKPQVSVRFQLAFSPFIDQMHFTFKYNGHPT